MIAFEKLFNLDINNKWNATEYIFHFLLIVIDLKRTFINALLPDSALVVGVKVIAIEWYRSFKKTLHVPFESYSINKIIHSSNDGP